MKKILYSVLALAFAAFTLTSCEDVPMPYDDPNNNVGGGNDDNPIETVDPAGSGTAEDPYNVAAALKIIKDLPADVPTTTPMYVKGKISSISEVETSQYGNASYYISDDGTSNNELYIFQSYYLGNVRFTSQDQIKIGDEVIIYGNFVNFRGNTPETVGKGTSYIYSLNGNTDNNGTDPEEPVTGTNLLVNGDFETWTNGLPDNWKSACSASKSTLTQSTDAHNGNYSVKVATASSNQRLAYKELTLKAGTYTMQFYAKAAVDGGQVNPGYVPVDNGSVGQFVYGGYVTLSTNEWTLVSNSFTLTSETTLCLVVMNPSNMASDVLIDDFTLVTSNGGISNGEEPGQPDSGNTIPYSIDFTTSQTGWTIKDVKTTSAKNTLWYTSTQYGYCASAGVAEDSESWLISPALDFSKVSTATMTINHAGKFFGTIENEISAWVSTDGGTNWNQVQISNFPTGWTFINATINLSSVAGKNNVLIGFKYISTTAAYGTWEIKTVNIN